MILASPRLLLLIKGLKYPCFCEKRYVSRWRMFLKFIWKTMPDLPPLFKRLVLNVIGLVLIFVIYTFSHNAWITCRILYFFLLFVVIVVVVGCCCCCVTFFCIFFSRMQNALNCCLEKKFLGTSYKCFIQLHHWWERFLPKKIER